MNMHEPCVLCCSLQNQRRALIGWNLMPPGAAQSIERTFFLMAEWKGLKRDQLFRWKMRFNIKYVLKSTKYFRNYCKASFEHTNDNCKNYGIDFCMIVNKYYLVHMRFTYWSRNPRWPPISKMAARRFFRRPYGMTAVNYQYINP